MRKALQWMVSIIVLALVVGLIDFNLSKGARGRLNASDKWVVDLGLLSVIVLLLGMLGMLRKKRNKFLKNNDSII